MLHFHRVLQSAHLRFFKMKRAVICSLTHKPVRRTHWAIVLSLLPILFCGCFDAQNTKTQLTRRHSITSLSRYFYLGRDAKEQDNAETDQDAGSRYFLQHGISASSEFAQDAAESEIALPAFFGRSPGSDGKVVYAGSSGGRTPALAGRGRVLDAGDLSILNSSFSQLFTSVFKQNRNDQGTQAAKEDLPNPFTEERLKRDASSSKAPAETSGTKTDSAATDSKNQENSGDKSSADSVPAASAGGGILWEKSFLILGDFDGSGRLSARSAQRAGDAVFVSDDGERGFTLYANYAAFDQKGSIYVDDLDGDGINDLLVTNGTFLFGSVLRGDGNGGYQIVDKFLTGYEPVIVSAGPFQNGRREILTVNARSGVVKSFTMADRYQLAQTESLSLLPHYLLHLVAPDTSRDFLLAGQVSGAEQILAWDENNSLQVTGDSLGADPTSLAGTFGAYSLRVYQVGNYASIVLGNQGDLFNVASLRVAPQTFLILGDIYRQGLIDVGVGTLSYFNPKK
jgi:hypothetical protein